MLTQPLSGEDAVAARQVKNGAAWFQWIAGLTVLNVVTALRGLGWTFLLSLLLPISLADTAHRGHASSDYVGTLFATVFGAGIYFLLGQAAKKGARWAFITGMIFYSIDTLLWIGAKEGRALGLILHVVALFGMGRGLGAANRWAVLRHRNAATENGGDKDEAVLTPTAAAPSLQTQIQPQIQTQYQEMQAQEAIAPHVLPKTPPPVAFAEIDALETRIGAPDTKIEAPSTRIDTLDDGIDDRIDAPEV